MFLQRIKSQGKRKQERGKTVMTWLNVQNKCMKLEEQEQ